MTAHNPPIVPPIVVVFDSTPDGTMVRWHRTLDDARNMRAVLSATSGGVTVGQGVYLNEIPKAWIASAEVAFAELAGGGDVSHLATHRHRFPGGGGPLDPVTPPAAE